MTSAAYWIQHLDLQPHVEGGYFRRTYAADEHIMRTAGDSRPLLTSIYYLLDRASPIGYFHRNRSDILHYFHRGSPLRYLILHPQGGLETRYLGNQPEAKQHLQLLVRGGCWKACVLEQGDYALLSEAVAPGFDYADMELATAEQLRSAYPQHWPQLAAYVKN